MRVVFAGTPPFAARALEAILAAGHAVPLVLTQPDRPAGRGLRVSESAVGEAARAHALPLHKPRTLRDPEDRARIAAEHPDVMVVAAYGLLLPAEALRIPRLGCLNIHASLLPRWRGAAPIQRAILAGDARTGITIMRMDVGLDTGPMLLQRDIPIGEHDTTGTLTDALARLGARCIVEALAALDRLDARAQDPAAATHAPKVAKREAAIDWSRPSVEIDRQVRAFDPAPGAETLLDGQALKVWRARTVPGDGLPGQVISADADGIAVACGAGALRLEVVQRAGGKRLAAADFLRGARLEPGHFLGAGGVPAGA
ncbi:MAG TPA: methionyl-tRNA formyltransferase [Usitatibacter sp.]|nr:methionyl-tRNA formyltransferase [Usitatibacter sp.]